jgi:dienelactone hydrolase
LLLAACAAAPLEQFPAEPAQSLPRSNSRLSKPAGNGPFPAVVMLHTCGGIGRHLDSWISRLDHEGYVVLLVDSFTPRGAGNICGSFEVGVDQVAADALAAAAHLRSLRFVDANRIGVVGFSYGAMAALRLSSKSYLAKQKFPQPFRAAVAFYPFCTVANYGSRFQEIQDNFYRDIATPLHLLLGGADTEAPAHLCTGHADGLKREGQPVSYTLFPGATHAFDQNFLPKGYHYDQDAVEQSWRELRDFYAVHLR